MTSKNFHQLILKQLEDMASLLAMSSVSKVNLFQTGRKPGVHSRLKIRIAVDTNHTQTIRQHQVMLNINRNIHTDKIKTDPDQKS